METQEKSHIGMSARETNKENSSKGGILKETSGNESITDISENQELIHREKVENTPFEIIGGEGRYWLSMGLFRLSEPKSTIEEVKQIVNEKGWETIINVMCAIMAGRDMELMSQAKSKQA